MIERPVLSPLPVAPVSRAAVVRLRDGATLGARVSPRFYAASHWLRCQLLTDPAVVIYVAVDSVAWLAWVTDARAREVAARYGDRFVDLAVRAPSPGPVARPDPSTAPPPAAEVLDEELLEPDDSDAAPRVWLALRRSPTGDRSVAPAQWASEHGAILPEVREASVAFQVGARDEGRLRAAASAEGLALADCCARCGWTDDSPTANTWADATRSVCSNCNDTL